MMEAVWCALVRGLVIMKLNLRPNSLSDFAISVTSLLPVIVSGLSKSLLPEESLASLAVAQNEQVHLLHIEFVQIIINILSYVLI
jgi:hypothetical protein